MELKDKEFIIKGLPFFSGLSKKELALVNARSRIVEYRKGQIIYEEGSGPSAFYCILSGRVQIYISGIKRVTGWSWNICTAENISGSFLF